MKHTGAYSPCKMFLKQVSLGEQDLKERIVMKIYGMRTNHLEDPTSFDLNSPVISYKVQDARGRRQSAACVTVYDEEDHVLYTSGMQENIDPLGCPLPLKLQPRSLYTWDVVVQTDAGEECRSSRASFETGKMHEAWGARWITGGKVQDHHRLLRRFSLTEKVKKARLYICGLGLYEVMLNGEKVGDEYFAPGCNAYDQWLQVQTYNITDQLATENTLCVLLGDGWYKGRFGFRGEEKIYGDSQMMICEIHITFSDGREKVINSDEAWQVSPSPVVFSNIYDGEMDDATKDLSEETPARTADMDCKRLRDRLSLPVRIMHTLHPARIFTSPKGETIVDLGQIITGHLAFRDPGVKGKRYHLQYGEVLQDGSFYNENLRSAKAEYTYISNGGDTWVRPLFSFYGFRYVKLEGFDNPDAADFMGEALYSDMEQVGYFHSSHPKVNRFSENVIWSQRDNFLDVPTDCPQRDERMGWTGDAQTFCDVAYYQMDAAAFMTKYMHDMLLEQKARNGAVPHVIPSFHMGGGPSCGWADAAAIIPWTTYVFYGDRTLLEKQYPNMVEWIEWIFRADEQTGGKRLWNTGFQWADWLALDAAHPDSCNGGTDPYYVASCYYLYSTELTSKAARALGHAEDAEKYAARAEEIRAAIRREYMTSSHRLAVNTQTGCILALLLKIATQEDTPSIRAALYRCLQDSRGELRTGFVGTRFLCQVLTANGMGNMAYNLFLRENYPGWLYEVNMGATTVWERWNSIMPDGHMSGTGMNSLNHYAYGSVMGWVYGDVAGLHPMEDAPGFRRVSLAPHPDPRMTEVDFRYESPAGMYRTSWKIEENGVFRWRIDVPFGCEAEITLPAGVCNGLPLTMDRGMLRGNIGPGHYEAECVFTKAPWRVPTVSRPLQELLDDPEISQKILDAAPHLPQFLKEMGDKGKATVNSLRSSAFCCLPSDEHYRLEEILNDLSFCNEAVSQ